MHIILNSFGSSLRKENGLFLIATADGKQLISPEKVRSISISRGAQISSDAALLAIENEIDVFFVEKNGKPTGRVWSVKYGSVSTIRRKQLEFISHPKAVGWIKELVSKKIDNQAALLLSLATKNGDDDKLIDRTINKLDDYKRKIAEAKAEYVHELAPTLRGWEGAAGRAYFAGLNYFLPTSYKFAERSQHPAHDLFNALLNYGYGMLYGKVEGALIKAGIDPYAGIMHRDDYNRPVLAFDVIELYRIWIDHTVMSIACQEVLDADCYSVRDDGSFWLENMGKRILIQSVNDYLDEVVRYEGADRSRANHIDLYAQRLAQVFLKTNAE